MAVEKKKLILFGGNGAISSAIRKLYEERSWDVISVGRSSGDVIWDPVNEEALPSALAKLGKFDAVVWAQGMNLNDDYESYESESHYMMYQANVIYILNSLKVLMGASKIVYGGKLCIISSIWQDISRNNKLSYSVTKSAIKGLVNSLSNDMAKEGILVNAVLPGAIDTPMTRENLSTDKIQEIESATEFNRLVTLEDVSNAVFFICSDWNTGVTGNFIKVDLGFSHVRNY